MQLAQGEPAWREGFKIDDLEKSFPTPAILWLCDYKYI